MATTELTITANIEGLRRELEKIGPITADQATAMTSQLNKSIKAAEKASLAAAKASKVAAEGAKASGRAAASSRRPEKHLRGRSKGDAKVNFPIVLGPRSWRLRGFVQRRLGDAPRGRHDGQRSSCVGASPNRYLLCATD